MPRILTVALLAMTSALAISCSDRDDNSAPATPETPETSVDVSGDDDRMLTMEEAISGPSNVALWQTGDEDTKVYLFGTVHLLPDGVEWMSAPVTAAWEESDTLFLEAEVHSQEATAQAGVAIMEHGFYTDGRMLRDLFTEEEVAKVDASLKDFNFTLAAFNNARPWLASIQVTQTALMSIGVDASNGIEMVLGQKAKEDGMAQRYFETAGQQIEIIASIPDEEWATTFLTSLDAMDSVESYFATLVGLWYSGDADGLADYMATEWEGTSEMKPIMLDNRNKDWADQLDEIIREEEGTFFIAVGAAHLSGENDLQHYLSEYGYETTRLTP